MKQILFRGKRIDNNEWVHGFYFESVADGMKHCYIKYETWDEGFVTYEVIPETVGQFTGRCDENYNKIFEGDILEVSYDDGMAYTTEVCAYGGTLCVDVKGEDYDFTAIDFAVDIWKNNCCECKVIGNIYENPELLEEL